MDPKIDPMLDPVLGEVLEVSWHHLGGILGRFGVSFGCLGPSWGVLGLSLECLWGFGPSWVCVEGFLAASWGVLWCLFGCFANILGRPGRVLRCPGAASVFGSVRRSSHVVSIWLGERSERASAASEASGASGRSCDLAQFQKASANASIACA